VSGIATDVLTDKRMVAQVEHILRSDALQGSATLKRLLRFLAEKSASGEVDQLKEYTIAVDALEKPSSYDPRHDSAVRIQIGRLRQKLAEYYRTEGKNDPLIIDLPKGHFKLTCSPRPATPEALSAHATNGAKRLAWFVASMGVGVIVVLVLGGYSIMRTRDAKSPATATRWTRDLQELWQPFVATNRPLIVAIEDPLFVELKRGSGVYYRDRSFDDWDGALNSPGVKALQKVFMEPNTQPSRYYTSFGEVNAAFLIGRVLGDRERNISVVKTSQLTWRQLADNDVVFVGIRAFFDGQLRAMPLQLQLMSMADGIRNVHPNPGEPEVFLDNFSTAPTEEGEVYALVTHLPGPVGGSEVESFVSNRAAGYVGAVQWFTDPDFARVLVADLVKSHGKIPHYYQVVLKVQFKDEVPTETSFVLSRELH
jgi:hypothetical protein